jgi:hypothetical protein
MKIFLFIMMVSLVGCSTMKESLVLGIGSGAATGAITGSVIVDKNRGQAALQGALLGGVIGGIASYFIHGTVQKRDDLIRRETLFNLEKFNVSTPSPSSSMPSQGSGPAITSPKVEMQWIDTQVQGKKLIEGHRVWIMTEDAQWIPSTGKSK